ncbi:glycosyltransferase family 25 protein [Psychrobacter urativorans]|nr:glycosyltransferase family 25 protein [Psychrobacter urativorans]
MKHIAVVSLVDEYTRRKHIDCLFEDHHLDFNYFDAINKQLIR